VTSEFGSQLDLVDAEHLGNKIKLASDGFGFLIESGEIISPGQKSCVAEIPQIVTAKYSSPDQLLQDIHLTKGRIRFLPIDAAYYGAARMDPEFCCAFWTSGAVCGPSVAIRLRDEIVRAKASNDWSEAKLIAAEVGASLQPLFPNGSFKEFSKYNIGLEKARMDAAGWMKAGPTRPPYHIIPEKYLEGARLSGRRWAELHEKYSTRSDAVAPA